MSETNEEVSLEDLVAATLVGIEKVSSETFIRIAQRVLLTTGNLHTLTAIAFMIGQPGLELTDPTALTIPEQIPPEEAEKIRAVLPGVADMLVRVRQDMETALQNFNVEENEVILPPTESRPVPKPFQQAIEDETLYLLRAGSDWELAANLALVLKGVGVILHDHQDEPGAVNIPFALINRLPDRRNEIMEKLKPFCNKDQWEKLSQG